MLRTGESARADTLAGPEAGGDSRTTRRDVRYTVTCSCAASRSHQPARASRSPTSSAPRGDERPDRASRARRRGHLGARARPRRLRPPPPEHHRPDARRPPADARRRRPLASPTTARSTTTPSCGSSSGERFRTDCDTEVVLRAHDRWGAGLARPPARHVRLRALGRAPSRSCSARATASGSSRSTTPQVGDVLYFASEAKALLPFLPAIATDLEGLKDYLAFQFCLAGKTLFEGVRELLPGHRLRVRNGRGRDRALLGGLLRPRLRPHGEATSRSASRRCCDESVRLHLRSDVPVAAYLSGGLDSSAVASLASRDAGRAHEGLHRPLPRGRALRRERATRAPLADERGLDLHEIDIGVDDFLGSIERVIYHLDYPAAGPGSFPQYMVSQAAARESKVILGGQGGDEIFGGYTRYLIAYFEQCIKAAIDGTMHSGNFVVTYESIIPNLVALQNYKPLLQEFWRDGLFEDLDARYFRLINRAPHLDGEVDFDALGDYSPFETFQEIFNGAQRGPRVVLRQDDPLRLQDAAAGAAAGRGPRQHGPRPRVARAAARPRAGRARRDDPGRRQVQGRHDEARLQARRRARSCPTSIAERKDKMGFPVPLHEWFGGPGARLRRRRLLDARRRSGASCFDNRKVLAGLEQREPLRPPDVGPAVASSSGSAPSTTASTSSRHC